MNIGKWNFVAGSVGLILAAIGGTVLGATFDAYSIKEGNHLLSEVRFYLREGHSHGMPMALLNLIFGLYIDRITLSQRWKKIGSIAALLTFFLPIGLAGILGFFVAAGVLAVGAIKLKPETTA